jgi:F0F1-type ATP synthase assembly protein I
VRRDPQSLRETPVRSDVAPPDARRTWQGFSDALARAVELVVTPLVFAALGWWLDGLAGTGPVLAIALGAAGVGGVSIRAYYAYQAEIARVEEGKPWTRPRP